MNRRSIFKCLLGAVAASAMEVCGWEGPKAFIPSEYTGEVKWYNTTVFMKRVWIPIKIDHNQ